MSADVRSIHTVALEDESGDGSVGGKAEGLRALMRAGCRVPSGFCLTTEAFEHVVPPQARRAETLEQFRSQICETDLPDVLEAEVREWLEHLDADRWAVRSSAMGEDGDVRSFAGQQRTELDVSGLQGVLDAIRRVWAGLFEIESLLYRERLRVDAVPRSTGVIVQEMVEARVGGVLFTRNPMELDEATLLIAAGDSPRTVVEGRGGASYYVDRQSRRIERFVPDRPGDDGGGDVREGSLESGDVPGPLSAREIRELIEVAERVESHASAPRDLEWVYGPEGLQMLQSRPITGQQGDEAEEPTVWTNANVGEALPGVGTPMTWSIIGAFSRRGFERAFGTLGLSVPEDAELVGSFRGRVYLNLTEFVSIASAVPILEPEVLYDMAGGGGLEEVRETAERRSPIDFLMRLPVTLPRIALSQLSMPLVAPLWSAWFDARVEAFFERDLSRQSRSVLLGELDRIERLFDRNGRVTLTCSSNFLMSYVAMKHWLEWFGSRDARARERDFVRALDVPSAEPGLELLELGRRARESEVIREVFESRPADEVVETLEARRDHPEVGRFLEAFETFRDEHGHRAPREAELATPRWREDDEFVVEVVGSYLDADSLPSPESYREEWRAAREALDTRIDASFGAIAGGIFRGLLEWARRTAVMRETMRTRVVESLDLYRAFALECGERLVDEGILSDAEEVFSLRYDEVRHWLEGELESEQLSLRVLVRQALVEALRELPDPPNAFVERGGRLVDVDTEREEPGEERALDDDVAYVLEGLSGNRGRVTGRARVIDDPESGETVRSGEILVAPYTDVGWTPLFMTASAIVMGLGGPLSHACIVAREFGLPTVVNARGATEHIETGDRVTVDGNRGVVYVHAS